MQASYADGTIPTTRFRMVLRRQGYVRGAGGSGRHEGVCALADRYAVHRTMAARPTPLVASRDEDSTSPFLRALTATVTDDDAKGETRVLAALRSYLGCDFDEVTHKEIPAPTGNEVAKS